MSPVFKSSTSHSKGRAPASSMVLKKIGAIFPPIHTPPSRLLGIWGISSPIYQSTEFVADLRDEPVPMTSPTRATGKPVSSSSLICASASVTPSRGFLYIAFACRGMSGLDQASWAGERSSVFVSPGTLKTAKVSFSGISGLSVNQSASAHEFKTFLASSLPFLAFSATSWKASNINRV